MHGPVPQASPPQPQVSHSITSARTPSVARSAASLWQLHLEYGVEPTHSCWICALPGSQGVRVSNKRCVPVARAGCGAATNSRHAFWDIFDAFVPCTRATSPLRSTQQRSACAARGGQGSRVPGAMDPTGGGTWGGRGLGFSRITRPDSPPESGPILPTHPAPQSTVELGLT